MRLSLMLVSGSAASLVSMAMLAWRGHLENGSAAAPVNAPSHWFWGRESLRRDGTTLRHTAVGAAVHHASSLFWAAIYALLQSRRRPQPVADAITLTAVAAVVDLKLVPARLTPGFEQRLSRRSLAWVYGGFAAGLVLGAALVGRRG